MCKINHLFTHDKFGVAKGPLPAEQAVTLRVAVCTEAGEAAVEIILVARLGEPIRCLCCSHHCAKSILDEGVGAVEAGQG